MKEPGDPREGDGLERPGIWQLAFPSILGNLSFTVVGMVQTKFVGELGAQALAAVGAGQRVFFAMQAVLIAVSAGTTALVARAWGAGDRVEASRVTMASLVLASAFSVGVMVVGVLFAPSVASLFGLDPHTLELAAANIRWLSLFNVAFAVNFILGAALRASGDAWTPLWISGVVNLLNIPLLYGLVFGNFGFPRMGVAGAAIAAGLAFSVGGLILVGLWMKQKFRVKHVRGGWWRKERLGRLLDIGYPAAVEQMVFQVGFFAFLMLIGNFYGTEAFAAYNIGVNMLMVCMTVGFGFSIAGSTLVGQHLGAGDHVGAERSGWRSLGFAVLSMGVLGLLVITFARELATFFLGDEPLTIEYTVQFTWLLGAMTPLLAVEFAIGGSLRGAGDTRFPLMATFFGLIGMRVGLAALFTYMQLPVFWVYAALVGDYLLKGCMLMWRFWRGHWKTVVKTEEVVPS
ncbi:MAG: MATE family efflux transporter [Pseudomonadales bacterium]|jgi:putative MATE family efflux protein|nr:MATE family efflux transporter [Pseudomonadales bacterium]|tara:strand:+ start:1388 stop:2764 length:1377 start_codon:yes stop_codon:yes gene_type:complete